MKSQTELTGARLDLLNACFRVNDLKAGQVLTQQDLDAIRAVFGPVLEVLPKVRDLGSVTFPKDGSAPVKTGIFADATITEGSTP